MTTDRSEIRVPGLSEPISHYTDAVTWRGLGVPAAAPSVGVLLAFGVAFMALAVWRFGRERA